MAPICPYCNAPTVLVDSSEVYDQSYGPIYLCRPCQAWVGCHKKTHRPLGTPANADLRNARKACHAVFDPIWRRRPAIRSRAYGALASILGIPHEKCHIGMFNPEQCRQVLLACEYGLVTDAIEPEMCEGCGIYPADSPSKICLGCEAYAEHEQVY